MTEATEKPERSRDPQGRNEAVVRRDMRATADKFTEIIAGSLHYFENEADISIENVTYAQALEMQQGAIDRYRRDAYFNRKVQSIVAQLMQADA